MTKSTHLKSWGTRWD